MNVRDFNKLLDECTKINNQDLNDADLNKWLTYKPAVITFLHHLHNVSFSELQLIWILWFVVVDSFVSKI